MSNNKNLDCNGKILDLTTPKVMGVINVTPDSFYEPSRLQTRELVLRRAVQMVEQGAAMIDIGGEATRPGVMGPVSVSCELERVIPMVEMLARELPVPISVDTSQAEVMREAIAAGAGFINDVRALRLPGALHAVAASDVPVCLMHMSYPDTTKAPVVNHSSHRDILGIVKTFLKERIDACLQAGISQERIVIDPGFGNGSFGKSTPQNYYLLAKLKTFLDFDKPLLVGLSCKTFVGDAIQRPVTERLAGSLALNTFSLLAGANIIRTHDVQASADAVKVLQAIAEEDDA